MNPFRRFRNEKLPETLETQEVKDRREHSESRVNDLIFSCQSLRDVLAVLGDRKEMTTEIDGLGEVIFRQKADSNHKALTVIVKGEETKRVVQVTENSDGGIQLTHENTHEKKRVGEKIIPVTDTDFFKIVGLHTEHTASRDGLPLPLDSSSTKIDMQVANLKSICEQLGDWALSCSQTVTIG